MRLFRTPFMRFYFGTLSYILFIYKKLAAMKPKPQVTKPSMVTSFLNACFHKRTGLKVQEVSYKKSKAALGLHSSFW